jgi:regulator of protease activity HflC (stomatin/prohibitin superfamily)
MVNIKKLFGNHKMIIGIILLVIAIASIIGFVFGIRTVPSGYVGIKTQWGSVVGVALPKEFNPSEREKQTCQ